MKNTLTALSVACSAMAFGQHANYTEVFTQVEEIPGFYSTYMQEYTRDVNEDLNRSFFLNLQTSASVLDTGEFMFGFAFGGGVKMPHSFDPTNEVLFNNRNLVVKNGMPSTLFEPESRAEVNFYFISPSTGSPLINPTTGESIKFSLPTPNGIGQVSSTTAVPSGTLTLGYGLGYGTEIRGYITPKFGAIASMVTDSLSVSSDFAYGLSVKHNISTWIPALQNRGWNVSVDVAYSKLTTKLSGAFFESMGSGFATQLDNNYEIIATSNLKSIQYDLTTMGGRLFIGKSFSWIDLSAFVGWMNNTYDVSTDGTIDLTLKDNSGTNPDSNVSLKDFMSYNETKAFTAYGASTTIGKGWFRFNLGYTYSRSHFATMGLEFHI